LFSLTSFVEEYATICFPRRQDGKDEDKEIDGEGRRLSKRDMDVLLKWLMRDCGVVVMSGDVRLSNLLSY